MKNWKLCLNLLLLIVLLLGAAFIVAFPSDAGTSRRIMWILAVLFGLISILHKVLSSDEEQRQEKALYEKYHPKFFKAIVIGIPILIVILRVCRVNYGYPYIPTIYILIMELLCNTLIQYKLHLR